MLMDRGTDVQKVITIAHPAHSLHTKCQTVIKFDLILSSHKIYKFHLFSTLSNCKSHLILSFLTYIFISLQGPDDDDKF